MSAPQTCLILGATGQTGRHLLQHLLSSSHFAKVGEYGRRVTPADRLTTGKDKLEQKTIDFEKIEESGLKSGKWDVVFVTLGTTRAQAGSAANFEKIDREYVVSAAKEARDPNNPSQRVVYLSSARANPTSSFLYPQSKGLTEQAIAALGYPDTIVMRPGFIAGTQRDVGRPVEVAFGYVTGFLSRVAGLDSLEIDVKDLAKSIYLAGSLGSRNLPPGVQSAQEGTPEHPFTVIGNVAAHKLAEVNSKE